MVATEGVALTATDGTKIRCFSIECNGITINLSTVGASICNILLPNYADPSKEADDVVLGYQSPVGMYESQNPPYYAVVVGRVANRIEKGRFLLNNKTYELAINNNPNHLHGGESGFNHAVWEAKVLEDSIRFSLSSKDGDQGYPGKLEVTATYSLTPKTKGATLSLQMEGKLLESGGLSSPISLAQHSYFNLDSHDCASGVLDHKLTMPSEAYTPIDPTLIPTKEVVLVDNDLSMDWRSGRFIRDALVTYGCDKAKLSKETAKKNAEKTRSPMEAAKAGPESSNPDEPYGFDHNYVVKQSSEGGLNVAGIVENPKKNRKMTVMTDAPGVQLYTANWLDGSLTQVSKNGFAYGQWQGVCLETQHFPSSILTEEEAKEHPEFALGKCPILTSESPSYRHRVEYHFEPIETITDRIG